MYRSMIAFVLLLSICACSQNESSTLVSAPTGNFASVNGKTLQEIVKEKHLSGNDLSILIDKSAYTFQVLHKDSLLITYPCVFGFDPVKDKHQEGDGCTPEGTFKIRSKYAHKSWSYFIWIDYPNKTSQKRFKDRKASGDIKSSATIGGEIGIHGVPGDRNDLIASKTNWTLGCISLTTKAITDVYKSIGANTTIEIVP